MRTVVLTRRSFLGDNCHHPPTWERHRVRALLRVKLLRDKSRPHGDGRTGLLHLPHHWKLHVCPLEKGKKKLNKEQLLCAETATLPPIKSLRRIFYKRRCQWSLRVPISKMNTGFGQSPLKTYIFMIISLFFFLRPCEAISEAYISLEFYTRLSCLVFVQPTFKAQHEWCRPATHFARNKRHAQHRQDCNDYT